MVKRRLLTLVIAGLAVMGVLTPAQGARQVPLVGRLEPGDRIFWDGARIASNGDRWSYRFDLTEPGVLLRVAVDVPDRTDLVRLELTAPNGNRFGPAYTRYAFNAEVFVDDPVPGRWSVEVRSEDAQDAAFRLRAGLFDDPRVRARGVRLPNLRLIPPYEFTFAAPVPGPGPLIGGDYENQPLEIGGQRPASCTPDETAEDRAIRCLRFTAGIENEGDGPLDLEFDLADPEQRMIQRVHRSDGSSKERVAGKFEVHPMHAHYHYADIWTFRLFKESGSQVEPFSKGRKSGFCPADQKFAEWRRFNQDPMYTYWGDCGIYDLHSPQVGTMALSSGWGDIYRWYRPGNYLDFAAAGDGRYVVQGRVDSNEWVLETTERDNFGYAYIEVEGDRVKVLERGRGMGPWDPHKIVIADWWKRLGTK